MNKTKSLKVIKWFVIICFVVSIIPLLILSFYAHPVFDDYSYSKRLHIALAINGEPAISLVKILFLQVASVYKTWQGTYSAVFMFGLQPGLWSESTYFITTFLIIGSMVLSVNYFWYVIIVKLLHSEGYIACTTAFSVLFFQIQFIPHISDAFYWYNASVFYIFFFSLYLIQIGLIISFIICEDSRNKIKYMIFNCLLVFFIEGGNYSTALVNLVVIVTACFLLLLTQKKDLKYFLPVLCLGTLGFVISVVAPGNSVRASVTQSSNAVWAIYKSLEYTAFSIKAWTHLHQIGLFILIALLFLPVVRKTEFKFRFPGLVVPFLYGIHSAQITPLYYASSAAGSPRNIDLYYLSYYIIILLSILYVEGWIVKKTGTERKYKSTYIIGVIISLVLLFISGIRFGLNSTSAYLAYSDLRSGRARAYDENIKRIVSEVNKAREEQGSSAIVEIEDAGIWTYCFKSVLTHDEGDYWANSDFAKYYGIDMVYYQ